MTLREAIDILSRHNKWRRGAPRAKQIDPGKIGKAIDLAIDVLECEALMHERCFGKEEKKK